MMIKHSTLFFTPLLLLTFLSGASPQETQEQDGFCDVADGNCAEKVVAEASSTSCTNDHADCHEWASKGECETNPSYMMAACPEACEVCFGNSERQYLGFTKQERKETVMRLLEMKNYLQNFQKNKTVEAVWGTCSNSALQNDRCTFWAVSGECTANPGFMQTTCAIACQSCDQLDMNVRCPTLVDDDPNRKLNAWYPGDLEEFFTNVTQQKTHDSPVQVLSRPPDGPWIVTLESFLSEQEAQDMIELGEQIGRGPSFAVGGTREDGSIIERAFEGRTSTQAWCENECYNHPTAEAIRNRIERLTSIPHVNYEYFQLLRYEEEQYYRKHHDYIALHRDRQPGSRILTVFLYLNNVTQGGGTRFPNINLTVSPKVGTALIWPSVFDAEPHTKDFSTEHEALPVEKGIKYSSNAWIHQRNYVDPHKNNCH